MCVNPAVQSLVLSSHIAAVLPSLSVFCESQRAGAAVWCPVSVRTSPRSPFHPVSPDRAARPPSSVLQTSAKLLVSFSHVIVFFLGIRCRIVF
ncbi:hypothetical protein F2P81_017488 [Scophthalmus maximus]|uniref:Uncharacterized protein n=1 Tax=Scophthalmus maximus TaxID=52904 RepID=A0A6A4S6B5_SCOMX|nr:hypothetical protein F2P81_017487 [Scophthalmus maximus]KAF0030757.1 hypothetical protein F2P81_017488 [Scophthalmus maximus]